MPELTIAQHELRAALGVVPLELADGCLRVDLGKLLGSTDGQLAAIDLASRWMAEGDLGSAAGLLSLISRRLDPID